MDKTRELDFSDVFETAVDRVLGDRIRADDDMAVAMWSALANIEWSHSSGDTASYTFRAAGDLVAAIRDKGNYRDWYWQGSSATVSAEITQALAAEGWSAQELDASGAFETAVNRVLGARIRTDDAMAVAMWSALANIEWSHSSGATASYTFRDAGTPVAAIRGKGDYLDWYGKGPDATVSAEIAQALGAEGWSAQLLVLDR